MKDEHRTLENKVEYFQGPLPEGLRNEFRFGTVLKVEGYAKCELKGYQPKRYGCGYLKHIMYQRNCLRAQAKEKAIENACAELLNEARRINQESQLQIILVADERIIGYYTKSYESDSSDNDDNSDDNDYEEDYIDYDIKNPDYVIKKRDLSAECRLTMQAIGYISQYDVQREFKTRDALIKKLEEELAKKG